MMKKWEKIRTINDYLSDYNNFKDPIKLSNIRSIIKNTKISSDQFLHTFIYFTFNDSTDDLIALIKHNPHCFKKQIPKIMNVLFNRKFKKNEFDSISLYLISYKLITKSDFKLSHLTTLCDTEHSSIILFLLKYYKFSKKTLLHILSHAISTNSKDFVLFEIYNQLIKLSSSNSYQILQSICSKNWKKAPLKILQILEYENIDFRKQKQILKRLLNTFNYHSYNNHEILEFLILSKKFPINICKNQNYIFDIYCLHVNGKDNINPKMVNLLIKNSVKNDYNFIVNAISQNNSELIELLMDHDIDHSYKNLIINWVLKPENHNYNIQVKYYNKYKGLMEPKTQLTLYQMVCKDMSDLEISIDGFANI